MTPPVRKLLVLSSPASWIPAPGTRVGAWVLDVERADRPEQTPSPGEAAEWDVVAFRVEELTERDPADALRALRALAPEATFLPVAVTPDPREALAYLKHGAFEYLEEPLAREEFLRALGEAIENRETFREILELNRNLEAQAEQLRHEKGELERKNRDLQAVSQLARALASTLDLDEILGQLARCVGESLPRSRISVGLLDRDRSKAQVKLWVPQGEDREPEKREMTWSLQDRPRSAWSRAVLLEGETLRVADPRRDPRTEGTPLAELHSGPLVNVPMVARGRIVGAISVESPDPGTPLGDRDLDVLKVFADTAAMAVENARLYQTMCELSVRDELTGLYNRRHLSQQLEAEWGHAERYGMPLALLMVDIDHFKKLNDGNDHLTGDAALRKVATLLLRNTRGIDTVARYGGEEFVVLLPRATRASARLVAEKLRRVLEEADFAGEAVLPQGTLTVSLGAAAYPEDASTPEELLERADAALYRAKDKGRNRVEVWEEARARTG